MPSVLEGLVRVTTALKNGVEINVFDANSVAFQGYEGDWESLVAALKEAKRLMDEEGMPADGAAQWLGKRLGLLSEEEEAPAVSAPVAPRRPNSPKPLMVGVLVVAFALLMAAFLAAVAFWLLQRPSADDLKAFFRGELAGKIGQAELDAALTSKADKGVAEEVVSKALAGQGGRNRFDVLDGALSDMNRVLGGKVGQKEFDAMERERLVWAIMLLDPSGPTARVLAKQEKLGELSEAEVALVSDEGIQAAFEALDPTKFAGAIAELKKGEAAKTKQIAELAAQLAKQKDASQKADQELAETSRNLSGRVVLVEGQTKRLGQRIDAVEGAVLEMVGGRTKVISGKFSSKTTEAVRQLLEAAKPAD